MSTTTTLTLHTALNLDRPIQIRESLEASAGDFIDDFDLDAIEHDYIAALDEAAGEVRDDLVFLWDANEIIADVDAAPITDDQAEAIKWGWALVNVDIWEIFQRHDRTN